MHPPTIIRASLLVVYSLLLLSCSASSTTGVHPSSITISRPTKQNQNGNDNGNDYGNGNDSVQSFLQDLSNLSKLENDLAIFQNSESKRDSSYTKSWKMEDWELHQRRSFFRYKRHLTTWLTSTTARAVFPTVIALSCWALLIQYLANKFDALGNFLSNSSFTKGVASFGGPISLLLALRTNRSLNRLFEARSMFGKFVRASTSLTSLTATYVGPKNRDTALLIGRYLSIYGWCMKGMFRREPDDLLILAMLPPKEAQWLLKQTTTYNMDTPTCMHARLRSLMATAIQDIPLSAANAMEDRLNVLESALGVNKRLLGSPIPPTYTRHTSRVLCLYLGLLPFALVGASLGQNDISFIFSMLVTIGATAYVFVGIDEIGVEIENPFPLIPMQYIATVIQRNVGHQMRMMDDLPAP